MADIDWDDVTDVAIGDSVVANAPAGTQALILRFVNQYFDASKWGGEDADDYLVIRASLAAHFATVLSRRGATGQITSSSAGGLSRSFSTMMTPDGLGVTSYGSVVEMMHRSNPNLRGTTT